MRNVQLVPLTWDDEVALLKRELAHAHASLRLEEQRNRGQQLGDAFAMRRFFDEFNAAGVIPVSLIRRQMTGLTLH